MAIIKSTEKLKTINQGMKTLMANYTGDIPIGGWINALRGALGLSMANLSKLCRISQSVIFEYEQREAKGTISLNSMIRVGDSLGLRFVYGYIVPDGDTDKYFNGFNDRVEAILGETPGEKKFIIPGCGKRRVPLTDNFIMNAF